MLDLSLQFTVSRMLREGPPRFLVWVTRCGNTVVLEIAARNSAEAVKLAREELELFERGMSAI